MKLTRRGVFKTLAIASVGSIAKGIEIENVDNVDDSLGGKIDRALTRLIQSKVVTKPEIWIAKKDFPILCEHPAFDNRDDFEELYTKACLENARCLSDKNRLTNDAVLAECLAKYKENHGVVTHSFKGARVITDIYVNRTIVTGWCIDGSQCSYDLEGPYKETK